MSRPERRWQIQRLRKAQLRVPCNGEGRITERSNKHNDDDDDVDDDVDVDDDDDIDDSLPGAYAISNKPFNERQISLWDSNGIHTTTIDQLLHAETSSTNENILQNHDDIPNQLDLNQDCVEVQPNLRNGLRKNKQIWCVSISILMVLSIIAIVSTIFVTKMNSHSHENATSFCYLDRKELVQCRFDFLELPSCANTTFLKLAMDLLDGNHSHPYPCDSKHFGLVAVAVAQVNEKDPIDDILQYWIMAKIYFSLGGQDWRMDRNWLTGMSPCHADWYGISCSENNEIVAIELLSNNVVGSLPTEIAELTSIRVLNLNGAEISGKFPSELGRMSSLSYLNLESSSLVGTLPTEIGLCENLHSLNLRNVKLSGIIPTEIGSLSNLTYLGLPTRVEGTLPTEIGLLSNLSVLDLVDMLNLRGSLPSQLIHTSNLSALQISGSFYENIMLSSLLSCLPPCLEHLILAGTFLIGQIPSEFSTFNCITNLEFVGSSLTGTLPSEIGLMTAMQSLKIRCTSLSGNIPSEIGKLTRMTSLQLANNRFSTSMPSEINQLSNLKITFNEGC